MLRICTLVLFAGFIPAFSARWAFAYFGLSCFEQVVFHTKVPLEGTNTSFIGNWVKNCVIKGIIVSVIVAIVGSLLLNRQQYLILCMACLILCLLYALVKLGMVGFAINLFRKTKIYEKFYADGRDVEITFPEKKRNLLLLYVESMETTYISKEQGGNYKADLMPEITALAEEHINFSHQQGLGGASAISGTGWTTGGLVGSTSGVPLCVSPFSASFTENASFLPGAYSLGDVLEKEGYEQVFLCGSEAVFGGRKFYYDKHGNYKIYDLGEARAQGKIPEDYREFWGFEDEKLFAMAKEELTRLSQTGKPFNLTMLTVDTHHPYGYVDNDYQKEYPEQLSNIIRGESRKVGAFIDWLKEQPFYEDTTVVIAGDHLSMAEEYIRSTYERRYHRTTLNVFVNAQAEAKATKNRNFTSFDMYPTILAAMGAKIAGNRLGFGVNLFTGEKTVPEQIGLRRFDRELRKQSSYFKEIIKVD